jgi:uncharacterized protein YgbK (DUF1537 family)
MRKKVGIVADDITGANDIGIMFAKKGYSAAVYPYSNNMDLQGTEEVDVVVIDTNSRFDSKEISKEKVYRATKKLMDINCEIYHNKTCSVFRGNIGAEFDAMQEALGIENSMVILGFPKNGRTTVDGIHYVNGLKLEESQFNRDPIHPMGESNLVDILSKQTDKKIGKIDFTIIDKGIDEIRAEVEKLKDNFNYIIFDVRNQQDLRTIAEAIKEEKNICGSSAIGEELPKAWSNGRLVESSIRVHKVEDNNGVIILAGSLTPQTFEQVNYLKNKGYKTLEFDTSVIYDATRLDKVIENFIAKAVSELSEGNDLLIHTSNTEELVKATKEMGYEKDMRDEEIGKIISGALSKIVADVKKATDFKKIVVAGGDTSASISEGLKIKKMLIIEEIEAGVPNMYGYSDKEEYLMVLKSGSFGSEEFLHKAVESLKRLQEAKLCHI